MRVLIAGAHGKIGQQVVRQMDRSTHCCRAMVRDAAQTPTMQGLGAHETVLGDLEQDCSSVLVDCDAVIFTAGSGPHTGSDKTTAVDELGAKRLADSARAAGVKRFLMVSSTGAGDPAQGPTKLQHYLRAKHNADEHLRSSGLTYTIVRPGPLTQAPGTGKIQVAEQLNWSGEIPRPDVAAVLVACLDLENTQNRIFGVLAGDLPVSEALKHL